MAGEAATKYVRREELWKEKGSESAEKISYITESIYIPIQHMEIFRI